MAVTGKRRFLSYLATIACITAVEIVNKYSGGGWSAFGQGAMLGASAVYFGGAAIDKYKNGKDN